MNRLPPSDEWWCFLCEVVLPSPGAGGPPTACLRDFAGCERETTWCEHEDPVEGCEPCRKGHTRFFPASWDKARAQLYIDAETNPKQVALIPDGTKNAMEVDALYRRYRLEYGLAEPQALEAVERDELGEPADIRAILRKTCLLDEWPVGWREAEWPALAKWTTFEDLEYWLARVVDTSDTNLFLSPILAAQGHLYPLLQAIGPAFHVIPVSGRYAAGKSRCGEILTYLGGGVWLASATVPGLKSARKDGPIIVGIDEGDEAEKDNPGVKAYLLASHDWTARYLKFSEPGEKGKRELIEIPYGGPVIITFRKKPWPVVASRAHLLEMEPSKRYQVSDDGSGEGFRRLLGPARIWLRAKCEEALRDKDALWAMRRTHEPDFIARLNRVTERAPILRQRDFARMVLFIAEMLGLDMKQAEARLTETLEEQELESENATIIEAIEADPLFQLEEVGVQELRLSVQKCLRDHKEFVDLSRNRFADVLKEMEFSKAKGPTWNRVRREGRLVTVILPGLWRKSREDIEKKNIEKKNARQARVDEGVRGSDTSDTSETTPYGGVSHVSHVSHPVTGPGQAILAAHGIIARLDPNARAGGPGAPLEDVLRVAAEHGIASDRTKGILKRMKSEGDVFEPTAGTYRLTEGLGR